MKNNLKLIGADHRHHQTANARIDPLAITPLCRDHLCHAPEANLDCGVPRLREGVDAAFMWNHVAKQPKALSPLRSASAVQNINYYLCLHQAHAFASKEKTTSKTPIFQVEPTATKREKYYV